MHKFRQDLFKKWITTELIESRPPYAIPIKMLSVIGPTRPELNSIITFSGIDENAFPSILRRCLVIVFQGQFVDSSPDPAQGVFLKDHDLSTFVISSPAQARIAQVPAGHRSPSNPAIFIHANEKASTDPRGSFHLRQRDSP